MYSSCGSRAKTTNAMGWDVTMAMKGIMIHYNQHRLEALEQVLSKRGLELDVVLAPAMERLYEQYVPAPIRGGIEMKVREDELRDTGEKRSSITLLCCTECGRESYLMETSSVLNGFYKIAGSFKNYFEQGQNMGFARFSGMQVLESDVFAELSETAMQHKLIDCVIDWNMDMGIVSYMNTQTGFQSFYLESDVLKAELTTKASECENFEQITKQFQQKLVGKECDAFGTYLSLTKAYTPQMGGM